MFKVLICQILHFNNVAIRSNKNKIFLNAVSRFKVNTPTLLVLRYQFKRTTMYIMFNIQIVVDVY